MFPNNDRVSQEELHHRIRSASTLSQILWTEGTYTVERLDVEPEKTDATLSILRKLATCLVRGPEEIAAVSLFEDRLEAAGDKILLDDLDDHSCGSYAGNSLYPLSNDTANGNSNSKKRGTAKHDHKAKKGVNANDASKLKKGDNTNGGLPKISEEWITGAEGASGTKMFDFLYDNCKKVQGGVSKLDQIDLEAHGQVVFKLFQRIFTKNEDWHGDPQSHILARLDLGYYVIGTTMSKLAAQLKEPREARNLRSWVKFRDFIAMEVTVQLFDTQQRQLGWLPQNQKEFSSYLELSGIPYDPSIAHQFGDRRFRFGREAAFLIHRVVQDLLRSIIGLHQKLYSPSEPPDRKPSEDDEKYAANIKRYDTATRDRFRRQLGELHEKLTLLLGFSELPNVLNCYIDSIRPIPNGNYTSVDVYGNLDDAIMLNQDINQEALDREELVQDETDDERHSDGTNGSKFDTAAQRHRKWQRRYKQWILGIIAQIRAASHLGVVDLRSHSSRLQNTTFEFIRSKPPSDDHMEEWSSTVSRALAHDPSTRDAVIEVLLWLQDDDQDGQLNETYKWLFAWKFTGSFHCEAIIACRNIKRFMGLSPDERRLRGSKIGVSRRCCVVCSFLLNAIRYGSYRTSWPGRPGMIWRCDLPEDCPYELVEIVSNNLDKYLSEVLVKALPLLAAERTKRQEKYLQWETHSEDSLAQSKDHPNPCGPNVTTGRNIWRSSPEG